MFSKIYFDKNGKVEYYVFNIKNASVTEDKKEQFRKVLSKFSKNIKLDIQREKAFAQCGKISYSNY
jgi:hypothetical protein